MLTHATSSCQQRLNFINPAWLQANIQHTTAEGFATCHHQQAPTQVAGECEKSVLKLNDDEEIQSIVPYSLSCLEV